jgi:hypothetical protein
VSHRNILKSAQKKNCFLKEKMEKKKASFKAGVKGQKETE